MGWPFKELPCSGIEECCFDIGSCDAFRLLWGNRASGVKRAQLANIAVLLMALSHSVYDIWAN